MKRRPWPFLFLTVFHLAVALSLPIQIMLLYGHGPSEGSAIYNKMALLNWAVVAGSLVNAFLAFEAHRLVQKTILASVVIVALNNWVVAAWSTDFASWTPLLATLAFCLAQLVLFLPDVQAILAHPDRRWWLHAQRHNVQFPIWIETSNRMSFQALTFDVSMSGAFVPLSHIDLDGEVAEGFPVPVRKGENILVRMGMGSDEDEILCRAEVVRRSASLGRYPAGLGLRFSGLDGVARRRLKRYLESSPELR